MHFEFINAPVEGCERFDIIVWNACEQSLILLSSQTLVVNSGYSITDDKYSFFDFMGYSDATCRNEYFTGRQVELTQYLVSLIKSTFTAAYIPY